MQALEKVEEALGVLLFAGVCVLVLVGALSRTIGMPLIWSIDMAQMLFAWTAVLGADVALKRWQHIEIDILVRAFPVRLRHGLAMLWLLVMAAFLATLVWLGVKLTLLNLGRELGDAGISYGWVTAAVPAGAALMLVTVLGRLVGGLRRGAGLNLEGRDGMVL